MAEEWKGTLGFGAEGSWGTGVVADTWLKHLDRPTIIQTPDAKVLPGTRGDPDAYDSVITQYRAQGEIGNIHVVAGEFDELFEIAMGAEAGGVYTLVDTDLPSMTIEENVGGFQGFRTTGAKIDTLGLSAAVNDVLMASLGIIAKDRLPIGTANLTATSYVEGNPFIFYQGVLVLGGVTYQITSFSLQLNNGHKYPNHRSGDAYTKEPTLGSREITGSFTTDFDAQALYDLWQTHGTAAMSYTFTSGSASLALSLPIVKVMPDWSTEADGPETMQTVQFRSFRDGSNLPLQVTIA